MALALELAERGRGRVEPNPMVGAVIVKNGRIVGKGYHTKAGLPHAEIKALKDAGSRAKEAALYTNLEPCCHFGRTPPCTDAMKKAGIRQVVAAMVDPNPLNSGKGFDCLRGAGVKVRTGLLKKEAKKLNETFIKFITRKEPFVIVKVGMSLDGKIATKTGESRWITGEKARDYVHQLRREVDGVLVGVNTVLKDDPLLTVRGKGKRKGQKAKPMRIVVDSRAKIPLEAKVLKGKSQTIIAVTQYASKSRIKALERKGVRVVIVPGKGKAVDLVKLMKELGKSEIASLLIEGGGEIIASAFSSRIVDKVLFFVAPKIIGGRNAPTPADGEGVSEISKAVPLRSVTTRWFADDLLIQGYVHWTD